MARKSERASFLARRQAGIGGSDAPAILGVSPFTTPAHVWAVKRGVIVPSEDEPEDPVLEWGRRLQEAVARKAAEVLSLDVNLRPQFITHPEHPILIGHPDAILLGDPRGPGVLEVKTSSGRVAGLWADDPAVYAQVQLQHYLGLGFSWGAIAVLIAGQEFRYWTFDRHERFVAALQRRELEWWAKHVVGDEMPEVRAQDVKLVDEVFSPRDDVVVLLPPDAETWDIQRERAMEEIKLLTQVKHEMEAKLKVAMGDASLGQLPGGGAYRLKDVDRKGYTVAPTTYRELRRIK